MNDIVSLIKSKWTSLLQIGAFISGVIALIVIPPPATYANVELIKFFISILAAFIIIPVTLFKRKEHFKLWLMISIFVFLLSITFYISYNSFLSKYVVNFEGNRIVVGNMFLPSAEGELKRDGEVDNENYLDGSAEHNRMVLAFAGGDATKVWDYKNIEEKKAILNILFYVAISLITILMICLFQTLRILYSGRKQ